MRLAARLEASRMTCCEACLGVCVCLAGSLRILAVASQCLSVSVCLWLIICACICAAPHVCIGACVNARGPSSQAYQSRTRCLSVSVA
eukprot:2327658-Alexandrium_andersonii.AAC.1